MDTKKRQDEPETAPKNIVAIFKVRFHLHRGNELVWQYPADIDLQGVEYQVICSGLHLVEKDTIYFSRPNGFGVGVYRKKGIDHDRGARMQAIGILVSPPKQGRLLDIQAHVHFLEQQLEQQDEREEDVEDNDDTMRKLKQYYDSHKHENHQPLQPQHQRYHASAAMETKYFQPFESVPYALQYYRLQQPTTSSSQQHPQYLPLSSSFHDMVTQFGPAIFVLWKAVLLKQRVLLMTPTPPMERLCQFVYNGFLMTHWQTSHSSIDPTDTTQKKKLVPKFNIGINDINDLEMEEASSYIACTSDTIFDIKNNLYDVLIKLPSSSSSSSTTTTTSIVHSPLQVNPADVVRYQSLLELYPFGWSPPPPPPPPQTPSTTMTPSSFASCRYQWITWWYSIHWQQILETGLPCCVKHPSRQGSTLALDDTSTPLLLNMNGDDAEEIDTPTMLDTTLRGHSNEFLTYDESTSSSTLDTLNSRLLGFFHVLSYQLVFTLQAMVTNLNSSGEDDNNDGTDGDIVTLGIQDMLKLGLDPWEDQYFIDQLGQLYLGKRIHVSDCHDLYVCCCTCNQQNRRNKQPIQL